MNRPVRVVAALCFSCAVATSAAMAQTTQSTTAPATRPTSQPSTQPAVEKVSWFTDPQDGAFDISGFLSTRTGFLPLVTPITEPAVGYGLGVGLVFLHDKPRLIETPNGPRVAMPSVSMVGGMGTENGSWAAFAGHLQSWDNGRIRYLVGGGYADLDLDWYGQGDSLEGKSVSYEMKTAALIQKVSVQIGQSDLFVGPTQRLLITDTAFSREGDFDIPDNEFDSTVSGLGLHLSYDTRNSLFSPTKGIKGTTYWTQQGTSIGSDANYWKAGIEIVGYVPLARQWTLGLRGAADFADADAPFYDLPRINLRGISADRYMDNNQITVEAELRYDIARRWTVVGFFGGGRVADSLDDIGAADTHFAGGIGGRYLIARAYDMRMGLDVAHGPDDWAVYLTVGTGWMRD